MRTTRLGAVVALAAVAGAIAGAGALRAAAPTTTNDGVVYIDAGRTRAAFATGQPLVETTAYKVHASRREAPGMAEIHTLDTDIIYVLEGGATIVAGGKAVNTKEVALNEIRGSAIDGGVAQRLSRGDLFIVPHGVPHWFTDVQAPFLYYVVKATTAQTGGAK